MKTPYLYIIEVCLCSGVLLGLYRWLFERRVPFRACRIYLLSAVALSAVIPALHIPVYPAAPVAVAPFVAPVESELVGTAEFVEPVMAAPVVGTLRALDWPRLLTDAMRMVYVGAVCVLFGWFIVRLVYIARLRRRARLTDCRGYVLAEHAAVRAPFSFLRTVYLGDGFDGHRRAIILHHEASHVRHRHSVERIVMEAMLCVLWFNPFVWVAARRLREVQEWEADRDVLDGGCDLTEYRMTLFSQLFGYNPDMTCGLSHSFTKNRFLMMTRNKWGRFAGWRLAAALPFVGGMLCLCGFTTRTTDDYKTATVHIASDGSVTLNGRPIAKEELLDFVTAEREKFAEADRKDLTVRIVSEPAENPRIFIAENGSVTLNGNAVTLDALESELKAFRAGLSTEKLADTYVELSSAPATPMSAVAEVKEVLRRVPLLKIRYRSDECSVSRMLSPVSGNDGKVKVIAPVPNKRNDLLVFVDKQSQVRVKSGGSQSKIMSLKELSGRIADFVSDKAGKAKQQVTLFELPDGRTVDYPVSRRSVFLSIDPRTPYNSFVSVQTAIAAGFDAVRDEVARKWFDKSFAALTDAERQVVWRAVPMNVAEAEPQPHAE